MSLWIDVKKLRESRGWLQQETAEKLGVSRPYLSAVENRRRGISINMIEALINVFSLQFDDFRADNEKASHPAAEYDLSRRALKL